jgi:hypothetical protein
MPNWELGYDDEQVTLGDGTVDVDMGAKGVQKVAGSRSFVRDPRLSVLVKGRPGASRPEHGHVRIAPIPLDEDGKPMLFCSGGHYAPVKKFGKRKRNLLHGRKDGLDDYCSDCRRLQSHRHTSSAMG